MVKCLCGCGQEIIIKPYHKQPSRSIPKYIHGHNGKGEGIRRIIQKLSKDILYQKYIIERKSVPIISNELNISETTLYRHLNKNNILIRDRKLNISKEMLYQKYIIEKKSARKIAKELNVSDTTIHKYLKDYNIPIRIMELEKKWMEEQNKEIRYCACGCGQIIKIMIHHKWHRIPKYIQGHHSRITKSKTEFKKGYKNLNKGKTMEEIYGEKRGKEIIKKSSETIKEMYKDGILIPWNKELLYRPDIDLEEIKELYENQEKNIIEIAKIMKCSSATIYRRICKSNIKLRKNIYGNNKFKTDDSHIVKSSIEREIDNFLFHHNIIHIYERKIGYGNYKCDFYLPSLNLYIEYFGLQGIKNYNIKTKKKLEIYQELGLKLFSIYPSDNLYNKLNLILIKLGKQATINMEEIHNG